MEKNYWSNKETYIFKFQQLLWKINNIFNKKKEKLFRWFIFTKKKRVYLQKKNICYVKLTKEKWRKVFVFMKKRIYKRKVFYFFKELQNKWKEKKKKDFDLPSNDFGKRWFFPFFDQKLCYPCWLRWQIFHNWGKKFQKLLFQDLLKRLKWKVTKYEHGTFNELEMADDKPLGGHWMPPSLFRVKILY